MRHERALESLSLACAQETAEKEGGVFGLAVTLYLFLGGVGSGACVVLSLMGLRLSQPCFSPACPQALSPRARVACQKFFSAGYAAALMLLLLGVICLLCDLEHPERVGALLASPAFAYLTVGAYALAVCMALSGMLALAWNARVRLRILRVGRLRALSVACVAVALVVAAYTGVLLSSVRSVPLWNSWLLPVLFVASALSCGSALVVLVARLRGASSLLGSDLAWVVRADAVAVLVELAAAVALVVPLWMGWNAASVDAPALVSSAHAWNAAASAAAQALLSGEMAWLFWGGFAGLGLAVPLVADLALFARRSLLASNVPVVMVMCVLLGGLALRVCIVEAGFSLVGIG